MIINVLKTVCSVLFWFSASVILCRIAVGLIIQEIKALKESKHDD